MVYLIVDKENENDFEKINSYKVYLQNLIILLMKDYELFQLFEFEL